MDERWCLLKTMSMEVSHVLECIGYDERAARMGECARHVATQHCECGCELVWRTNYCRDRVCPVCEWRKSIVMARRAAGALTRAYSDTHDVVMMTLTVRNVEWSGLRETLGKMHRAFASLWRKMAPKRQMYGYIRRTEVTVGRDGLAHPHMHILIDRHSEGGYIPQKELVSEWRREMGIDYDPIVDIRVCWEQKERRGLTRYIHKYCTKSSPSILLSLDAADAIEYIEAVKGMRLVSSGGSLKMKDPDEATEDELMAGVEELVLERKWCERSNDFAVKCPRCGKKMQLERSEWDQEARAYVLICPKPRDHNCLWRAAP